MKKALTIILILLILIFQIRLQPVKAAVSSCTASVTPNSVTTYSTNSFTFTIENTDSVDYTWIKITRPSDRFSITGGSVSGWSFSLGEEITLTNGTLAPSGTQSVGATVEVRLGEEAASADWTVQVSDDSSGANAFSCTGNLGTAISGQGTDTFAPIISDITVSSVSDTSVDISWTTDEPADSTVEYGTTSSYGSTTSDSSQVTSHSISLTGLSANVTYHYKVTSTDSAGNSAESEDSTFVTSEETTTVTVKEKAPTISSVSASASITQATITWTTDKASDSQVEYGTTNTYGQSSELSTARVKNHSVTISNLKPNTTYHFLVKSKIESGNLAISSDYTFTTKRAPPPKVSLDEPAEKITKNKTLTITGTASSVIAFQVEISLNGGETWTPVGKKVSGSRRFSFTTPELEDDNYSIVARVIDDEGQEVKSDSFVLVVDTIPPWLGGNSFFLGAQKLFPDEAGVLSVPVGLELSMVVSAVGGPTMVQVKTDGDIYNLERIAGTNLWQGKIAFSRKGRFTLEARSVDGAENKVVQNLNPISVVGQGIVTSDSGEPVEGSEVLLYVWDESASSFVTGGWQQWEAQGFGQKNPQKTDSSGGFYYLLPKGTYRLVVKKAGFRDFVSKPFTIGNPTPITLTISLERRPGIELFGVRLEIPWFLDFLAKEIEIMIKPPVSYQIEGLGLGKPAANFSLPSTLGGGIELANLRGRKVLLSFWTTWDPISTEQITVLDEIGEVSGVAFLPIAIQESQERVSSFLKRGGYLVPSLVDEKGEILDDYRLLALPQHVLIGENGNIKEVKVGALSKEEILELIK